MCSAVVSLLGVDVRVRSVIIRVSVRVMLYVRVKLYLMSGSMWHASYMLYAFGNGVYPERMVDSHNSQM